MKWGTLQFLQVMTLVSIAAAVQLLVIRARAGLVERLEEAAPGLRPVAAVLDVIVVLLYLGFIASVVAFRADWSRGPAGPADVERALDTVAGFAFFSALVQTVGLVVLYRIAEALDPWPRRAERARERQAA